MMRMQRLLNCKPKKDFCDRFVVRETPDMGIVKMLLDSWGDELKAEEFGALEALVENMDSKFGVRRMAYERYNLDYKDVGKIDFEGIGYHGPVAFGRAYSTSYLVNCPKKVRNTIFGPTHVYLDIVSSYPTMLAGAFESIFVPTLSRYVKDRDSVLRELDENHGISKSLIKDVILKTICGFPYLNVDGRGDDVRDKIATTDFMGGLMRDLKTIVQYVKEQCPEFYEVMRRRHELLGKDMSMLDGAVLAMIAGDLEHTVMRTVMDKVYPDAKKEYDDMVLIHDGLMFPRSRLGGVDEGAYAVMMSEHVQDKLGFYVGFSFKPMDERFPDCRSEEEKVANKRDLSWKGRFEREFFFCSGVGKFVRVSPYDGSVQFLTAEQFSNHTSVWGIKEVAAWRENMDRRTFERVSCIPPPLECDYHTYNTWAGFAAEKLADAPPGYDLSLYLRHVEILCGENSVYADYFHKLMAMKFQRPGESWRVAIFVRSIQGVGKDVWFNFISSIIGSQHTFKGTSSKDVWGGKGSGLIENKLLVCFTEENPKDMAENESKIKDHITNHESVYEMKHERHRTNRNVAGFVFFTNKFSDFKIDAGDRRFFFVQASGRECKKEEYIKPLINWMDMDDSKAAVFKYYLDMDISNFDPTTHMPVTETKMDIIGQGVGYFDRLLKMSLNRWIAMIGAGDVKWFDEGRRILAVRTGFMHEELFKLCEAFGFNGFKSVRSVPNKMKAWIKETNSCASRFMNKNDMVQNEAIILLDEKEWVPQLNNAYKFCCLDMKVLNAYIDSIGGHEDDDSDDGRAMLIDRQP